MSPPPPRSTGHFELGGPCPHCAATLVAGDRVVGCPKCGISQHESCWDLHGGCGSYHCIPGTTFDHRQVAPDLVVTEEDLGAVPAERLAAQAAARRQPAPPPPPEKPERTSRLAAWSLGLGVGGVLTGIPGPVAAVLGGLAMARIGASRGKLGGSGLAVAGILLGVVSTVGWLVGLATWLDSRDDPFTEEFPREIRLEGTPEPIARALRRSVFVEGSVHGTGLLGGTSRWVGSGVILSIASGKAIIVTNRHVALGDEGKSSARKPSLRVRFIGGEIGVAVVRWLAPGGADLALITCDAPAGTEAGDGVPAGPGPAVGAGVFAVGNPRGLGWTFTRGVVSGYTSNRSPEGRSVEVIQTQTPISPGSSGGGLFDEAGRLVGINTWTATGPGAEGLHFAISAKALADLLAETGEALR